MLRYKRRNTHRIDIKANPKHFHRDMVKRRGTKVIDHYESPRFSAIKEEHIGNSQYDAIIWSHGDTFYKLANEYYGDPKMWWVLAHFNNTPTEAFCRIGMQFLIPRSTSLSTAAVQNRSNSGVRRPGPSGGY